ncbi:unnamed protein product [Meloidogyne enterolobii]|uniref:Uncharacterized protein n=1 Tax=Meloidogyne enterolobii TaxID=390850 RepID=A0ACB1AIL2_MELEN
MLRIYIIGHQVTRKDLKSATSRIIYFPIHFSFPFPVQTTTLFYNSQTHSHFFNFTQQTTTFLNMSRGEKRNGPNATPSYAPPREK